jgi:hypothetical protein
LFAESLHNRFPDMDFTKPDFDYYQGLLIRHDPEKQKLI